MCGDEWRAVSNALPNKAMQASVGSALLNVPPVPFPRRLILGVRPLDPSKGLAHPKVMVEIGDAYDPESITAARASRSIGKPSALISAFKASRPSLRRCRESMRLRAGGSCLRETTAAPPGALQCVL